MMNYKPQATVLRKQYTSFLAVIFLIVGFFYSCSKSPKCWGNHKNKGIIESSIRIGCEPQSEQIDFVIDDDSTYQQLLTGQIDDQLNYTLPSIDFNKYSLLGQYSTGACEVKYVREVLQISSEQKYHYKVIVKSCGACLKESYSFNWVTVPKLPEGWTVTFEIEEK